MVLSDKILQLTVEVEKLTVEWVFNAIDVVNTQYPIIIDETDRVLSERYGNQNSREKVYAYPRVRREVINSLVGEHTFDVGEYYKQRGVNRNLRAQTVIDDVAKDYNTKRKTLENKILKLANGEDFVSFIDMNIEKDGELGCFVILSNGDMIEVKTITAGGWNIQKFHFRSLVKRIKNKKD